MRRDLQAEWEAKRPALLAYVRGIVRNAEAAEEITQEAMLRAHRSFSGLKDHDRAVPWLYRIATNVCRDYFRQKKRSREEAMGNERDLLAPEELRDENAPRLDKVMECTEMGECVQRYFNRLSAPQRAVILLHDVEGMTNKEIAAMLDISLATAKVRLHRARKKLRDILEDVCHFSIDERGVLVCEPKRIDAASETTTREQYK